MLKISPSILKHLINAATDERDRLGRIGDAVGENWPEGFDANDIALYDSLIEELGAAIGGRNQVVELWGKPLAFLLSPLPDYVRANQHALPESESSELLSLHARGPWHDGLVIDIGDPDATGK